MPTKDKTLFLNELSKCKSLYDIMALSYFMIKPYHSHKGVNCEFDKYEKVNHLIATAWECNQINPLVNGLKKLVCRKEDTIEDNFFYNIIHNIDASFPYIYPKIPIRFSRFKTIGALNQNTEITKVYILPKMQNSIVKIMEEKSIELDKKGLRSRNSKKLNDSINCKLLNYVIYSGDVYMPHLTILTDNNSFMQRVLNRESLKIGLIPLVDEELMNLFDFNMEKKDTFSVIAPKKDRISDITEMFINQLHKFSNKDVDIIIFPEMYLTDEIVNNSKKYISEALNTTYDKSHTKIIIAGTLWSNQTNICFVFDHNGKEIFRQNKFEPFEYKEKLEDLKPSDNKINILDINEIGRIFILICKDIMNNKLFEIFDETRGNIFCYSAYSPSLDIDNFANFYATGFNGISIFSNACAARSDKKKIGFCSIPEKHDSSSKAYTQYYGCDSTNCLGHCTPQIMTLSFTCFETKETHLRCNLSISKC